MTFPPDVSIDRDRLVDLANRLVSTPSFTGSEEACTALVRGLAEGVEAEIVTIVAGAEAGTEAAEVASRVRSLLPASEVQVVDGGQSRYRYLIGVE